MALTAPRDTDRATDSTSRPRLADGVELIGEYEGSGYKQPPSLVRRSDGQVLQLPPLLYAVAARADGRRDEAEIAADVSNEIKRRLDADQVEFLIEEKLRPLGILTAPDGSSPALQKPDPFLALKFRVAVISERTSNRLGRLFSPLFFPIVVVAALSAFLAVDVWLFASHGVAQSIRQSLYHPELFLPLFGAVVLSAGFHEVGHAAACRYGGGRPGKMGCGIYLAWPAFYTDVTDAYRLSKRARLRTDLGGVYFNVIVVLMTAGAYFATGFEPLLLLIIIQHFEIAHQLLPVVRLDGYYIVADITGVPDLFARIGPILRSMVPWSGTDERVTVLKRWVRVAVTTWVCIVVPLLVFELFIVLIHLPRIIGTAWDSSQLLMTAATDAFGNGHTLDGATAVLQLIVLAIPIAGIVLMLCKVVAGVLRGGWRRTDGRPVLRSLFLLATLVAAGLLAFAWVPGGNYAPIRPGERGTLGDGFAAATRITRGDAPLYSTRGATSAQDPATDPAPTTDSSTTTTSPISALDASTTSTTVSGETTTSSSGSGSTTSTTDTTSTTVETTTTQPSTTTTAGP